MDGYELACVAEQYPANQYTVFVKRNKDKLQNLRFCVKDRKNSKPVGHPLFKPPHMIPFLWHCPFKVTAKPMQWHWPECIFFPQRHEAPLYCTVQMHEWTLLLSSSLWKLLTSDKFNGAHARACAAEFWCCGPSVTAPRGGGGRTQARTFSSAARMNQ